MGMKIVTGRTGMAHVTSADDGAKNAGIIGKGKYILDVGNKFAYEIISNNLIRIKDGYGINQGRQFGIERADYEECEIDNGLQGVKRTDFIVAKYKRDSLTGLESVTIAVIKGTSGDNYTDPEYVEGNILNGDAEDDFLLYKVKLNGLSIIGVEPLFHTLLSLEELSDSSSSGKLELIWSNSGSNFNTSNSYLGAQMPFVLPKNKYDTILISCSQGECTTVSFSEKSTAIIKNLLNVNLVSSSLYLARRTVTVDIGVDENGISGLGLSFSPCYYRPFGSGEDVISNNYCVPFKIYGIRK